MRNRIHVTNTTFHVDEVNKVVICILQCDMQMCKHSVDELYRPEKAYSKRMPLVNYNGTFTVKAKAKCNASDTFDVKIGKRLAESRAKTKMYHVAERVWIQLVQYLNNITKDCIKSAEACAIAKDIEDKHIKELEQ